MENVHIIDDDGGGDSVHAVVSAGRVLAWKALSPALQGLMGLERLMVNGIRSGGPMCAAALGMELGELTRLAHLDLLHEVCHTHPQTHPLCSNLSST